MKKVVIILISVILLLSSFILGFFVKKHIDDERFDSLNLVKMTLENKNEKFAEEIISLDKTVKKLKALNSNNWEKITDDIYIDQKSIDDKKYNNWKLESLKLSNEKLLNIINNLEIRPLDFYLYDTDPDRFEKIIINKNGDVEYKGKFFIQTMVNH